MPKNHKTDAEDFNTLKKLGFEFLPPQDEYSYQPDSGSTANGKVGKQEYGIEVALDAQPSQNKVRGEGNSVEDSNLNIPGESEYSQQHRLPPDELEIADSDTNDDVLFELIQEQLNGNPNLHGLDILVEVERGVVTLTGEVSDEETRVLVHEVVVSVLGLVSLSDEITVFAG